MSGSAGNERQAVFELIDTVSGNIVGLFDTIEEALASVRATLRRYGPPAVIGLGLGTVDDEGDGEPIATGTALIALATAVAASPAD